MLGYYECDLLNNSFFESSKLVYWKDIEFCTFFGHWVDIITFVIFIGISYFLKCICKKKSQNNKGYIRNQLIYRDNNSFPSKSEME